DVRRRAVTYHPTIWGDYFLAYTSDVTDISAAEKQELEKKKEMVTNLLTQIPDDSFHKLDLINAIQRLGVGYHFEKEIDTSFQNIHDNC
ncbi:selinene synthase, partial [Phtheirospermum japonicum]